MNYVRKFIRTILSEVFDNISELPQGIEIETKGNTIYYKFPYKEITYAVELIKIKDIGDFQMPDKKLKEFILKNANAFSVSFGIIKEGVYYDGINTNQHEAINILKFVCAIILKFIKDYDVHVLTFLQKNQEIIFTNFYMRSS